MCGRAEFSWSRAVIDSPRSFQTMSDSDSLPQLRRAAISVPSNVAEGSARLTTNAFVNHLSIARGSLAEVETCIEPPVTDHGPPVTASSP